MSEADLAQVIDDIGRSPHSEMSKRSHVSRIRNLWRAPGFPDQIAEKSVPSISRNGKLATTLAYLRSTLSVCQQSPTFRGLIGHEQRRRLAMHTDELGAQHDELKACDVGRRPTDIRWETVLGYESLFPRQTVARLIYLLYTRFGENGGVQRADWTPMKIVDSMGDTKDETLNYLVREPPCAVFHCYKTASRYGTKITPLLPEVMEEVPQNQQWLFQHNENPIEANTLSKMVTRAFKKYTGTHVTINILRRAWAEYSMRNALSPAEERSASLCMDHSMSIHRQYAGLPAEDRAEYMRSYQEERGDKYRRSNVLKTAIARGRLPTRRSIEKYNFSQDEMAQVIRALLAR